MSPSPFSDEKIKTQLSQSKQRLVDSTPEYETVTISRLMWDGAKDKWTWSLYRTTPRGDSEKYAEIPQQPHADYAIDQEVLKGIFHLYPEVQYLKSHPQQMAFWPNIECKFKRVKMAHGKGTRLALVSFKQCDHYAEHDIEREEQLQKLMGKVNMNNDQHLIDVANSAQAEAEQEAAQWAELGDPDEADTPKRVPLTGRVKTKDGARYHIPKHMLKWYNADPEKTRRAILHVTGGKEIHQLFPVEPPDETPMEAQERHKAEETTAIDLAAKFDAFLDNPPDLDTRPKQPSFEVTLALARNTAMVTFGKHSIDTSKENFKAATGHDNALHYMSQPDATVEGLEKAIAAYCLAQNAKNVTQAASTPVEPIPISTPAANGNGQSLAKPETTLTVVDQQTGEIVDAEMLDFDPRSAVVKVKKWHDTIVRLKKDKVLVHGIDFGPTPGSEKDTLKKPGAEKFLQAFDLCPLFPLTREVMDWKTGLFYYQYECQLIHVPTGKMIATGKGSCNSMESKYRWRWVTKDRVPKHLDLSTLQTKGGKLSEPDFAIEKSEATGKWGKPAEYWQQFKDAIANGTAVTVPGKTKDNRPLNRIEIDTTMYGIPNEDPYSLVNTIDKMAQKRALVAAVLNGTGASEFFTQDLEDFGYADDEVA